MTEYIDLEGVTYNGRRDVGYACPTCGTFRSFAEGRTECKTCGAHLRPAIKVIAEGRSQE